MEVICTHSQTYSAVGPPAVRRRMTVYTMAGSSAGAYGVFLNCVYERKMEEEDGEMKAMKDA